MCVKVEGWSSFRGPGGRGYALDADPPLAWSAGDGTHILWKTAVPTQPAQALAVPEEVHPHVVEPRTVAARPSAAAQFRLRFTPISPLRSSSGVRQGFCVRLSALDARPPRW